MSVTAEATTTTPSDAALGRLAEQFRREGFVAVRGLIPADELARYGRACDEAVAARKAEDPRTLGEKTPYEQSFIQCQYLWEDTPGIRPLTFHPAVGRVTAALLGAERVRLWHDQALYKEAGGRETDAHQDHPYWPIAEYRTLTAWIPFTAVDDRNGCMGYVPSSHLGDPEFIDIFRQAGAGEGLLQRQAAAPVFVPANPGDVLFHEGRTVHLAHPNRSDATRRVYTAIYFADGCTRSTKFYHPSVDREGIAIGARIEGYATPVTWPLDGGAPPEPGPWPAPVDSGKLSPRDERSLRARRLGIVPKARA